MRFPFLLFLGSLFLGVFVLLFALSYVFRYGIYCALASNCGSMNRFSFALTCWPLIILKPQYISARQRFMVDDNRAKLRRRTETVSHKPIVYIVKFRRVLYGSFCSINMTFAIAMRYTKDEGYMEAVAWQSGHCATRPLVEFSHPEVCCPFVANWFYCCVPS